MKKNLFMLLTIIAISAQIAGNAYSGNVFAAKEHLPAQRKAPAKAPAHAPAKTPGKATGKAAGKVHEKAKPKHGASNSRKHA